MDPDDWLADVNVIADRFWFGRWDPRQAVRHWHAGDTRYLLQTSGFDELLEGRRAATLDLQETKIIWDALCRIDRDPINYPDVTFPKLLALLSQPNAFFPSILD